MVRTVSTNISNQINSDSYRNRSHNKNSHPLVLVFSGITCPNGGLFACTFRFKFAGNGDSSAVSKFLLLFAMFFLLSFSFLGFANNRLSFILSTIANLFDGDGIGRWKEATVGTSAILSVASKATAETAMEHKNGNLTVDCVIAY